MEKTNPQNFSATLRPHRSLSRRGFVILMAVLIGLNFAAGTAFYMLGAWPIAPFMGLDVALVWWAFRKNYDDALKEERIEVTEHELVLKRFDHERQREELHFTRTWVKVELEEDKERDLIGSLYLRFKGQRTEIGRFLAAAERQRLARLLQGALAKPRI
ncbi:DUF2244 domain-containing protein [Taklimakanibacter lacteus]|uniref:DUF2244 domain-containing protein n=1 Tax=Taklimakanibacter lacteus TaxID=2268456 RepID=UPI000E66FD2C